MVDGGVLDPVPVGLARILAPGLPVVAVPLSPKLQQWKSGTTKPKLLSSLPFINRLYKHRLAQSLFIFLRSVDIAGAMLTDVRLQIDNPDVTIRPVVDNIGLIDPVNIHDVAGLGEQAVEKVIADIRQVTGWRRRISNHWPWPNNKVERTHNREYHNRA